METEQLQQQVNDLHIKHALMEGKIMDRVRAEFATKEQVDIFAKQIEVIGAVVRRLDKSVYAAIVIAGLLIILGRIFARVIG
jgi:hypothetical protein